MLYRGAPVLNGSSTDAVYLRGRARKFRRQAGEAGDAVIHAELLRLADLYDRMAENAEIERPSNLLR
jgi:hypothetical protein